MHTECWRSQAPNEGTLKTRLFPQMVGCPQQSAQRRPVAGAKLLSRTSTLQIVLAGISRDVVTQALGTAQPCRAST